MPAGRLVAFQNYLINTKNPSIDRVVREKTMLTPTQWASAVGTLRSSVSSYLINARIDGLEARLNAHIASHFQSGMAALGDAQNSTGQRRREFLLGAREHFRQASIAASGTGATRALEYMGVCYELLEEPSEAQRLFHQAYAACRDRRASIVTEHRKVKDSFFGGLSSSKQIRQCRQILAYEKHARELQQRFDRMKLKYGEFKFAFPENADDIDIRSTGAKNVEICVIFKPNTPKEEISWLYECRYLQDW